MRAIRKSSTAEVRVSLKRWEGRNLIDVREWWRPKGSTTFIPSSKGVSIDADKLPELLDRLAELRPAVGG